MTTCCADWRALSLQAAGNRGRASFRTRRGLAGLGWWSAVLDTGRMSWRPGLVIGAALVAGGAGGALVAAGGRSAQPGLVVAVGLLVAWSFVAVGVYAWERRPDCRTGPLMCAVGFTWLLSGLTLTDTSLLYTVGLALSGLWYAVLAHMLLAFPSGRLTGRTERWIVWCAYAVAIGGQLVAMPFFAPARLSAARARRTCCSSCGMTRWRTRSWRSLKASAWRSRSRWASCSCGAGARPTRRDDER